MIKLSIAILIGFLIAGGFSMTIKPFSVSLPNWRSATGILIIVIGAAIYYDAGRRKGWNEAIDKVIEVIDQMKKEKQNERNTDSL